MKAYKVFNPDWACQGFKHAVGQTYSINSEPVMYKKGFHACKKDVFFEISDIKL